MGWVIRLQVKKIWVIKGQVVYAIIIIFNSTMEI